MNHPSVVIFILVFWRVHMLVMNLNKKIPIFPSSRSYSSVCPLNQPVCSENKLSALIWGTVEISLNGFSVSFPYWLPEGNGLFCLIPSWSEAWVKRGFLMTSLLVRMIFICFRQGFTPRFHEANRSLVILLPVPGLDNDLLTQRAFHKQE